MLPVPFRLLKYCARNVGFYRFFSNARTPELVEKGRSFKKVWSPNQWPYQTLTHVPEICPDETRLLVIYCGGTVGMVKKNGLYVTEPHILQKAIRASTQLTDSSYTPKSSKQFLAMPSIRNYNKRVVYHILEHDKLMDSSDMAIEDWVQIGREIKSNYSNYDGFVILHGTDSMTYTASALSFMLEDLGKPVVLTGSQIPFSEVCSDALDNIGGALVSAGCLKIPEVSIYFNRKLFRGNRCLKTNNWSYNAFSCPNEGPLVCFGSTIRVRHRLLRSSDSAGELSVFENLSKNVSILRLFPSMPIESVRHALKISEGVVLQTYGFGNIPARRRDIMDELRAAIDKGSIVVNCTQCLQGRIQTDYENGQKLADIGVTSGADMTSVAALTKLSYVLGKEPNSEKRKELMMKNLRSELTECEEHDSRRQCALVVHAAAARNETSALRNINDHVLKDHMGRIPLHTAADRGSTEAVKVLLRSCKDVNVKDSQGFTALDYAVRSGKLECVTLIRRAGGVLVAPRGVELANAAARGDIGALRCYKEAGCSLDEADYCGRNALLVATACRQEECARFLAECGVDATHTDCCGHSAMSEAVRHQMTHLVDLFQSKQIKSSDDITYL